MPKRLPDAMAREMALHTSKSWIVQAPAGSGKTHLLTMRILNLLCEVSHPHAILAITFTRKAADEMSHRVMAYLDAPETLHDEKSQDIAKKAQLRAKKMGWHFNEEPELLNLMTFDALSSKLIQHQYYGETFEPCPSVSDHPSALYRKAAEDLLSTLSTPHYNASLKALYDAFDARYEHVIECFSHLLSVRDQWLPYLYAFTDQDHLKDALDQSLIKLQQQTLSNIVSSFENHRDLLHKTEPFFHRYIIQKGLKPLSLQHLVASSEAKHLPYWQSLTKLLLTQKGYRKKLTIREGFPSKKDAPPKDIDAIEEMKNNWPTLMDAYQQTALDQVLIQSLHLPSQHQYLSSEWSLIEHLCQCLPKLYAHFKLQCEQEKSVDFTEISLEAIDTLNQSKTALLHLGQVPPQHLLVDEYQDTSLSQHRLLSLLVEGWQYETEHSVFIVGDPMQSIYRFRQANVSLFYHTIKHGLSGFNIEFLELTTNFRSSKNLVKSFNHIFQTIFPKNHDASLGAIPYTQADAIHEEQTLGVTTHWLEGNTSDIQDEALMTSLLESLKKYPNDSHALLVRSRSDCQALLAKLNQHAIPYQAHAFYAMAHVGAIIDCMTLIHAFYRPSDAIAQLALLRSPMIGLSHAGCHVLMDAINASVYQNPFQALFHYHKLSLEPRDHAIARAISPLLQTHLHLKGEKSPMAWIYDAWFALGGADLLRHETPQRMMMVFFSKWAKYAPHHFNIQWDLLEEDLRTSKLSDYSKHPNPLHIMTIHQAKGLEFDHVWIPYLERMPPPDRTPMLRWHTLYASQKSYFLLCPTQHKMQSEESELSSCLRYIEQKKSHYEISRLLYVALTRAKKSLHLFAHLKKDAPPKRSLLAHLAPVFDLSKSIIHEMPSTQAQKPTQAMSIQHPMIPASFCIPKPDASTIKDNPWIMHHDQPMDLKYIAPDFETFLGLGGHYLLHRHYQSQDPSLNQLLKQTRSYLQHQGCLSHHTSSILEHLQNIYQQMQQDAKGHWLLNQKNAHSEFTLFDPKGKRTLDLIFQEGETLWIIDFKFKSHLKSHNDLDGTLIEQHKMQLKDYQQRIEQKTRHTAKLALYLPMQSHFVLVEG